MKKKWMNVFLVSSSVLEQIKKKKTEYCCAEPFLGYCPNDIVRKYFVMQVSGLYCRDLGLNG